MKVLFLVDKYYPESSANTVCSDVIMNYFKAQGDSVDFLAIMESANDDMYSVQNGSNVIKIPTYHNYYTRKFGKIFKAKNWLEFPVLFRKGFGFLYKLTHKPKYKTQNHSLDSLSYNYIYKCVTKVCDKYDVIISSSMPFALHAVASELMKKKLADKWFAIFLDPFVHNKCLDPKYINYRKKITQKILNDTDGIFMVDGVMEENIRLDYNPDYHKKVIEYPIPNLVKPDVEFENSCETDGLNLVYAGIFYDKIRNPKKMFDILQRMPNRYTLNIYGGGCEKEINQYQSKNIGCKVIFNGRVEHKFCIDAIRKANVLVNLSNTITNQMPSKVFEYISYGKPVINFYFTEDDPSLKYFKKYPLAFNINVNNYTDNDIQKLIEFCEENKYATMSFEDATSGMVEARAENICKMVYNVVKGINDGVSVKEKK